MAVRCRGITWMTKEGLRQANYWGSITQSATVRLGNFRGEEVFTPITSLLPTVKPEDIVFGGWDISSMNLADAMQRAQVKSISPMAAISRVAGCKRLHLQQALAMVQLTPFTACPSCS